MSALRPRNRARDNTQQQNKGRETKSPQREPKAPNPTKTKQQHPTTDDQQRTNKESAKLRLNEAATKYT